MLTGAGNSVTIPIFRGIMMFQQQRRLQVVIRGGRLIHDQNMYDMTAWEFGVTETDSDSTTSSASVAFQPFLQRHFALSILSANHVPVGMALTMICQYSLRELWLPLCRLCVQESITCPSEAFVIQNLYVLFVSSADRFSRDKQR